MRDSITSLIRRVLPKVISIVISIMLQHRNELARLQPTGGRPRWLRRFSQRMRSQSVRSGPAPPFPMSLPSMRQKRSQARERQE